MADAQDAPFSPKHAVSLPSENAHPSSSEADHSNSNVRADSQVRSATHSRCSLQDTDAPRLQRSARKLHTICCPEELSASIPRQVRFLRQRQQSIVGFEVTVDDQRRTSACFGPSMLQQRRNSVIGLEGLENLLRQRHPETTGTLSNASGIMGHVPKLRQGSEAEANSKPRSPSSTSSSSSESSEGSAGATAEEGSSAEPSRFASIRSSISSTRSTHARSTLLNPTESSRLRGELTALSTFGRPAHRRSSVLGFDTCSGSERGSVGGSSTSSHCSVGQESPSFRGRRGSVVGPRFRTQSTLDFMVSIRHDCLKQVEIFKTCDAEFVEMLMEYARAQIFQADYEVLKEGEAIPSIYVLAHGTVETRVGGKVADTRSEGSVFGHEAALGDICSIATIRTKTFCDCRVVPRDGLKLAMKSFPSSKSALVVAAKAHINKVAPGFNFEKVTRPQSATGQCRFRTSPRIRRKSMSATLYRKSFSDNACPDSSTQQDTKSLAGTMAQFHRASMAAGASYLNRRRSSVIGFETTREEHRRSSVASTGSRSSVVSTNGLIGWVPKGPRMQRRSSVLGCETFKGLSSLLADLPELPEVAAGSDTSDSSSSSSSASLGTSESEDENELRMEVESQFEECAQFGEHRTQCEENSDTGSASLASRVADHTQDTQNSNETTSQLVVGQTTLSELCQQPNEQVSPQSQPLPNLLSALRRKSQQCYVEPPFKCLEDSDAERKLDQGLLPHSCGHGSTHVHLPTLSSSNDADNIPGSRCETMELPKDEDQQMTLPKPAAKPGMHSSQGQPFWLRLNAMKPLRWRSFGNSQNRRHRNGLTLSRHCSQYSTFRTRSQRGVPRTPLIQHRPYTTPGPSCRSLDQHSQQLRADCPEVSWWLVNRTTAATNPSTLARIHLGPLHAGIPSKPTLSAFRSGASSNCSRHLRKQTVVDTAPQHDAKACNTYVCACLPPNAFPIKTILAALGHE